MRVPHKRAHSAEKGFWGRPEEHPPFIIEKSRRNPENKTERKTKDVGKKNHSGYLGVRKSVS